MNQSDPGSATERWKKRVARFRRREEEERVVDKLAYDQVRHRPDCRHFCSRRSVAEKFPMSMNSVTRRNVEDPSLCVAAKFPVIKVHGLLCRFGI